MFSLNKNLKNKISKNVKNNRFFYIEKKNKINN